MWDSVKEFFKGLFKEEVPLVVIPEQSLVSSEVVPTELPNILPEQEKPSEPSLNVTNVIEIKKKKKKIPTRKEVNQLLFNFTTGTIPTRVGPYGKIKETKGKNRSPAIDAILKAQGGSLGDPYCQAGVQEILDEKCRYYKIDRKKVRIPEGVSTQAVWSNTIAKYKVKQPVIGSWVNWKHGNTWKGHTGEVIDYKEQGSTFISAEFNTSAVGQKIERDGEGFYYGLSRKLTGEGDMHVNGFIDVYQALVDAMLESKDWIA